jgi:hypothetical protein
MKTLFNEFIEKHSKLIILVLAVVVVVFILACSTDSVICQWLFGRGVS